MIILQRLAPRTSVLRSLQLQPSPACYCIAVYWRTSAASEFPSANIAELMSGRCVTGAWAAVHVMSLS